MYAQICAAEDRNIIKGESVDVICPACILTECTYMYTCTYMYM